MKFNKLRARWSKKEADVLFIYPRRCDGHFLYSALACKRWSPTGKMENSIIEELEARGYDTTTIRFEIKLKEQPK